LAAWGEAEIKDFVKAAMDEELKLESALARLRTPQRIAVLHYSPIRETVVGEPPEIFPFLGTSRLENPLNRFSVTAVVHGHAHRGTPEGRTSAGIPVYNVSLPLLQRHFPDRPPFRLIELHVTPEPDEDSAPSATHEESGRDGERNGRSAPPSRPVARGAEPKSKRPGA
jgi:hypothetical protein